jgi:IS66 C-terminal element
MRQLKAQVQHCAFRKTCARADEHSMNAQVGRLHLYLFVAPFVGNRDLAQARHSRLAALTERELRAVVLGRRNYLFAGSDTGGESAAAIYSLIGTAKLNDVEPEAYLRELLSRIADHPINRIEELLPWSLAAASVSPAVQPAG